MRLRFQLRLDLVDVATSSCRLGAMPAAILRMPAPEATDIDEPVAADGNDYPDNPKRMLTVT